jgi:hypothetical protein
MDESRSMKRFENAATVNVLEHVLNALKAALATAPFCGGLASLMTDYIPSRRLQRLEAFADQVGRDLKVLSDRVQMDRLKTDQYAFIFERCLRGAADFPQEEKLEAFRGILVNSLLPGDLTQDQREYFLSLVERLSAVHLRILRFMSNPRGYLAAMGIPEDRIGGGFSDFFPVALPGVPVGIIRAAFADLHTFGFTNTDPIIFKSMSTAQGLHLLGDRITPVGKAFVAFCQAPQGEGRM